jgi:hypothetical protein
MYSAMFYVIYIHTFAYEKPGIEEDAATQSTTAAAGCRGSNDTTLYYSQGLKMCTEENIRVVTEANSVPVQIPSSNPEQANL